MVTISSTLPESGIDLLHQVIAGDQDPQRAVVPVEPVRPVAFRGAHAQDAKVFRIHLRHRADAQGRDPQRLGLRDKRDAVHAAAPGQLVNLDGLASFQIGLNHFAERLVGGTRRTPAAHAAVGAQPQVTGADRHAAGVVRLGLHFVQHLARLPVNPEDALRDLIADPQAVRRGLQRVGMNVGRLEQPLDLGRACRHLRCRRTFLRRGELCRRHSSDHRRRRAEELSTSDLHGGGRLPDFPIIQ